MFKYADIARELGVSKATVSLAVNNKPGVNEETRRKILELVEAYEKGGRDGKTTDHGMIKAVVINHKKNAIYDPELDLWTDVLNAFDRVTRKNGYSFSMTFLNEAEGNEEEILSECSSPHVSGVLIFGTEAVETDMAFIRRIGKPVVLYDYEDEERSVSSVGIDHDLTLHYPLSYLFKKGIGDIRYFATSKTLFNFEKRREAFRKIMLGHELMVTEKDLVHLGENVQEMTQNARQWLEDHPLPEAMIFENYQVSIAMLSTLGQMRKGMPGDVELIGIDEIPSYMISSKAAYSYVSIPHAERAEVAVCYLMKEIENPSMVKYRIQVAPVFVPFGTSGSRTEDSMELNKV